MRQRKAFQLVLGAACAALFLWLALGHLDAGELARSFQAADARWIAAAAAVFFVGYACRIARWRAMLAHSNPQLGWADCAGPFMACVAANNVLPLRAGDVLRAFGFNGRLGTSAAASLASVVVERLLDLLMVVAFLGAALAWFGLSASHLLGVGSVFLLGGAALLLLVLLFPSLFEPAALACVRVLSTLSPPAGTKLGVGVGKVFTALRAMAQGSTMLALVGWSFLAWLSEGFVFWLCALALPSITVDLAAWLALPVGTLATVIPSTPGYVGTFDFFVAQAMAAPGNTAAAAAAFALLVHAVLWLPPTLIGGLYLLAYPAKQLKVT